MPHPVVDLVIPAPYPFVPTPFAGRALLSDEEWQALLWSELPMPCARAADEALPGEPS